MKNNETTMKTFCMIFFSIMLFYVPITSAQWTALTTNTTENLNDIFFLDKSTGFVAGSNGTILKTSNAGTSWSPVSSATTKTLSEIYFPTALIGYIVGEGGVILKTGDGGSSWSVKNSGVTTNLNGVWFVDNNNGTVVGENGLILRTTDGGVAWTPVVSPTVFVLNAVRFTSTSIGYAIGAGGAVIKTIDGGANWTFKNASTTKALYGIDFVSDSIIYVAGTGGIVIKSIDAGANWVSISNANISSEWLKDIHCLYSENSVAVGVNGVIERSLWSDLSWTILACGTSSSFEAMAYTSMDTGYVCGSQGTILKTVNGGGLEVRETTFDKIDLNVFPNPFDGQINFVLTDQLGEGITSLNIYDAFGRMVSVHGNEAAMNNTETSLDLSGFSSGIYFYSLKIGDSILTGKIVKVP